MKWININDQVPDPSEHKTVICQYKSGHVKETPTNLVELSGFVEYWMPMPTPLKKAEHTLQQP